MLVGIFYNEGQVPQAEVQKLVRDIRELGGEAEWFSSEEAISSRYDRLVVLGGDGTVLRGARRASEFRIPLFGVNFGHLGFLTELERKEIGLAAGLVMQDSPVMAERSMLEIDLNGTCTTCLNECVLIGGAGKEEFHAVHLEVRIDGSGAGEMVADGLIVATPTGSTAYSLSAGGSIVTPDCSAFILTPVCAFSLRSRPIVYSSESTLTFSLGEQERLLVYGDGKYLGEFTKNDRLTVRKSERRAVFLTRSPKQYFRRLTEKFT